MIKTIFTASIVTSLFATNVFASATGCIVGEGINIRNGASSDAAVLGGGHNGSEFVLVGKTGDWFQVSFNGSDNAYVSADYFKVTRAEGTANGNGINVRTGASTSSSVIKTINAGDVITIIGQNSNWYRLAYNNGNAYVSKDFLTGSMLTYLPQVAEQKEVPVVVEKAAAVVAQNVYGIVTANSGLNIRTSASGDANVVQVLDSGEVVDVLEQGSQWIKVKSDNGTTGYVSADYLSVRSGEKPSRSVASSKGEQVVAYAKQFIGTPYVYGGTNLKTGVDCSGFVYSVMKNFGITLNRSSSAMASNGVSIDKAQLVAGDLVFFDTTGSNDSGISHVGIYIDGGSYIHASSGKAYSVTISNLNDAYSARTYVSSRRVLR